MTADLSGLGIDKKPIIESVEFSLNREGENVWEDVGLGFSNLTEEEKGLLKSRGPISNPILLSTKSRLIGSQA